MMIRDRIKEFRRVDASLLRPNPKNWRTHGDSQRDALKGVLSEIGIADAAIAREMPDGTLMLIDGHLRAETMAGELIPVLVLDVTEDEADKLLVTLDPLANKAGTDKEKLISILHDVETQNDALAALLEELRGFDVAAGKKGDVRDTSEYRYQIVVECEDEAGQASLMMRFHQEGIKCRALIS